MPGIRRGHPDRRPAGAGAAFYGAVRTRSGTYTIVIRKAVYLLPIALAVIGVTRRFRDKPWRAHLMAQHWMPRRKSFRNRWLLQGGCAKCIWHSLGFGT